MPRVKVGPAPPDVSTLDVEIARLRDLDVASLRPVRTTCSDGSLVSDNPYRSSYTNPPIG